jgi:hypothetical protein
MASRSVEISDFKESVWGLSKTNEKKSKFLSQKGVLKSWRRRKGRSNFSIPSKHLKQGILTGGKDLDAYSQHFVFFVT